MSWIENAKVGILLLFAVPCLGCARSDPPPPRIPEVFIPPLPPPAPPPATEAAEEPLSEEWRIATRELRGGRVRCRFYVTQTDPVAGGPVRELLVTAAARGETRGRIELVCDH